MARGKSKVILFIKGSVLGGILLFFVLFAGALLFRNALAKVATDTVLTAVQSKLRETPVSLQDVRYDSVNVQSSPLLHIEGARVALNAFFPDIVQQNVTAYAKAGSVDFHWSLNDPQKVFLEIRSIEGNFEEGSLPKNIPFDGLKDASLSYELKTTDLLHPKRMSDRIRKAVEDLYEKNYTKENFRFKGDLSLRFDDTPFCVSFYTASVRGGGTVLRLDAQDLKLIARNSIESECSDEEIDLMVKNPLKTPYIIYASLKARKMVLDAVEKDSTVPYDAYRHVLWSYYLTRKLGPTFAAKVTNARENRTDNTSAEHAMDYNNNKVGTKYALSDIVEAEILHLVRTDPNVILKPQE